MLNNETKQAALEIPDWVENTPGVYYELSMATDDGDEQRIEITREEYLALKERLATLRGYILERPLDSDPQQQPVVA
jgi:hypothetical protein